MKYISEKRGVSPENIWNYENGFYWFSDRTRVNKLLSHYELYKKIVNIPGHVFELGVYKAASLIRFATFRDALENDYARKIVGFDAFGAFPTEDVKGEDDLAFIQRFEVGGGEGLGEADVYEILSYKGFENIDLIKGNVYDSLPEYLKKNPESRVALLHLDMDVKEPTDFALNHLYDRVVSGGLVVFDDYNAIVGETVAADNFLSRTGLRPQKLPFYNVPMFVQKP